MEYGFPSYFINPSSKGQNPARHIYSTYRKEIHQIDDSPISQAYFIDKYEQALVFGRRVKILSKMEIEGIIKPFVNSRQFANASKELYSMI